jgi:hypothetical protein
LQHFKEPPKIGQQENVSPGCIVSVIIVLGAIHNLAPALPAPLSAGRVKEDG